MEVGRCRKVKLWERQRHQRSWITNIKKLSKTADTVIVPNGITLEHYQKHRDKPASNMEEFRPSRPKRRTAAVAKVKIRDIQQEDDGI